MPSRPAVHRPRGHSPRQGQAAYDRARAGSAGRRFLSSAAWRKLRALALAGRPLCERCEAAGRLVEATQVHHRLGREERPDLALVLENLECLCASCHSRATRAGQ
jgi:5-methylcytosine-specific restriction protein A